MRTKKQARIASGRIICMAAVATISGVGAMTARGDTFTYTGGNYTQNFDRLLATNGTTFSFAAAGPFNVVDDGAAGGAAALTGWQHSRVVGSATKFTVDDGNGFSGSTYSYGTVGSTERALGSLASGTSTPMFGAVMVNNSTSTYTGFTLSYTGEEWRRGTALANTLSFSYAVGAASIIDPGATFVNAAALNFTAPNTGGSSISLDGNAAINRAAVNATVGGLSWAPGQTLVVRWSDVDDGGNDDGLGIDDLSFTGAFIRSLTWNPGGNNWNTTDTNWLNGATPTSFMANDTVNFTNTGVGAVNVDAAGVSPSAVNVTNTSGTYVFSGGPIGGGAKLTKTGGGSLTLSSSNSYLGGTEVDGGVLSVAADNVLGAPTGGLTLNGGTLRLTGNVNSTRNVTLPTAFVGSTIDTGSNTGTFSQIQGAGDLDKVGSGTLVTTFTYGVAGQTHLLAGTLVVHQTGGSATFTPGTNGGNFLGTLIVDGPFRMNLQDGVYSGGGVIKVTTSGAALSNAGVAGQFPFIQANIQLNSNSVAQPFVTTIGGVGGNGTTIDGVISGASDVNIASAANAGGGSGTIILNKANTWTGATTINNGSVGFVVDNVNNALPTGTSVTFGTASYSAATGTLAGTNGPGILDLNGHTQMIAALATGAGTNATVANARVLSTNGLGTLIVNGSVSTTYAGNLNNGTGSIASGTFTIGLGDGSLALVKSGSSTLTLSGSNTYTGSTTINGGALAMVGSQAWNPALNGPGTTDIQTGRAIFDHSAGGSPAAQIQTMLTASYGTGFATGQIHSSTATSQLGLGWTDDGSKTTVAYTYFGDANLDLNVDTVDFNLLAANFSGTGKNWGQGDFNYDGAVDTVDFNLLAANFSKTAPGAQSVGGGNLGALVPEPTGLALAGAIGSALIARRRRRQ